MEAVIFVGIQASGKSTFYLQRFFETHVRINLDMLRTRHREQVLIEACVAGKQSFVIDNTNATREQRARYIAPARAASDSAGKWLSSEPPNGVSI
jgi:predicted kinase